MRTLRKKKTKVNRFFVQKTLVISLLNVKLNVK